MKEYLKVDLRIARQHSGLTAQDVATLLGCARSRLSKLENGFARPRVREIIALSVVYGKPLDSLFQLTASRLTAKLRENLAQLDFELSNDGPTAKHRLDTLNGLMERLSALNSPRDV